MNKLFLLSVLITLALLSGCASTPTTVYETVEVEVVRYETTPVPEALLRPCSVDVGDLWTNADLERTLAEALLELRRCTDDKAAIRDLE